MMASSQRYSIRCSPPTRTPKRSSPISPSLSDLAICAGAGKKALTSACDPAQRMPLDRSTPGKSAPLDDARLRALAEEFRAEIAEVNAREQAEFADWQRERRRWQVGGSSSLS